MNFFWWNFVSFLIDYYYYIIIVDYTRGSLSKIRKPASNSSGALFMLL